MTAWACADCEKIRGDLCQMDHNILEDPVIRFSTSNGSTTHASLPAVFAALIRDEIEAFPALRPHQRHAWHAFLAQLGALAVHRAGLNEPPDSAGDWRRILRGLTPGFPDDDPWHLIVDDITKPAFMQPPARSDDRLKEYKTSVPTPDGLDMLVLSKNHDIKSAVAAQAEADDWIMVLITLQTMEGYAGRYKYGISRMPSGYGNRPAFSITPSVRYGLHIKRDVEGLLEHRQSLLTEYLMSQAGIGLVWLIPWDGTPAEALTISSLDPFYIEVCRRIRLQCQGEQLKATSANSDARRIVDVKGLTGDPWAPNSKVPNKQGTPTAFLGPRKLGYARIVEGLASSDWEQPCLLRPVQSERDSLGTMQLVARGMVRGEGGTEGYHERIIPLKPKTMQALGRARGAQELGEIAWDRITQVGIVQSILRHAVATLAAHGNSDPKTHRNGHPSPNDLARPWMSQLDAVVDSSFFEDLQTEFEADPGERKNIRIRWLMNGKDGVVDLARNILSRAEEALPCRTVHRYRARANANNVFEGRLPGPRGLPILYDKAEEN